MTLAELNAAIVDALLDGHLERTVKVVLVRDSGEQSLHEIESVDLVREWTETPKGRQLQYKTAIVCKP